MKKFTILLLVFAMVLPAMARKKDKKKEEDKKPYEFTMLKEIPTSAVKNQNRSGTCWSFAGTAFLETELIRLGKGEVDLSEMFSVRHVYSQKAINTVRWHGNLNFGMGGNFHDVLWVYQNYGAITEEAYSGLQYGEDKHVHGEMDALLDGYVKTIIQNKNRKITPVWHQGFNGILDAYLGEVPSSFDVDGKSYNTKSYAEELGLNMDDYVEITSFTHHPFYAPFILEIPDNWMMAKFYNVPLEEMMQIMEEAIKAGYSVGWDADVSEKGFSWKNGVALVPNDEKPEIDGMESEKWEKMDEKERQKLVYAFDKVVAEKEITAEMRQQQFDNYKTTDDHLMLLTGIAQDQRGETFYKVKNSWSEKGSPYDGFFFASTPFMQLKTVSILLHKDALSKEMKEKLNIK
jgi:bleomycin hydrolase